MESEISIRPLLSMADALAAEQVQIKTWNIPQQEIIPAHTMHALQFNGAVLLGAFADKELVGYVFGVLGTVDTPGRIDQIAAARLKMYSVILGVIPEYQKRGIGHQLKRAQREAAMKLGIRLITWTYDPLESLNARFNIVKLGAVCERYRRNFHGDMGGLNAGLSTDRFDVDWWVTSNRVKGRIARQRRPISLTSLLDGGAQPVNTISWNEAGLPVPALSDESPGGNLQLVEIPADFQAIKVNDLALAKHWRRHTRELFEGLFDSGFVVTDFVSHQEDSGRRRSFYLLTHGDSG